VEVYTSNIHNVEAIILNFGLECCSHSEMILTLKKAKFALCRSYQASNNKIYWFTDESIPLAQMPFREEILSTDCFLCSLQLKCLVWGLFLDY